MTSFDLLETSRESSQPLEVYTFTVGSQVFRYTSAEDPLVVSGNTYAPESIARSAISVGPDQARNTLTITLPGSNQFAAQYVDIVPGLKASLTIIRLQRNESPTFNTQLLVYKGQVQSVRMSDDGQTAEIAVRSLEYALNRTVPRFTFMGSCNHVLYGPGCDVNPGSFQTTGVVTAVVANVVTVAGASSQPDGYWRGGFAKPVSFVDFRLILRHVGDQLTLLLPFSEDVLATQVQIFAGCDHRFDGDCANKFNNVQNFGGFPYVPTKNPFETGVGSV